MLWWQVCPKSRQEICHLGALL
jgi:hypothetical protein